MFIAREEPSQWIVSVIRVTWTCVRLWHWILRNNVKPWLLNIWKTTINNKLPKLTKSQLNLQLMDSWEHSAKCNQNNYTAWMMFPSVLPWRSGTNKSRENIHPKNNQQWSKSYSASQYCQRWNSPTPSFSMKTNTFLADSCMIVLFIIIIIFFFFFTFLIINIIVFTVHIGIFLLRVFIFVHITIIIIIII